MKRSQHPPLDWEDVRYFMAVARHGTLLGAARFLHAPVGQVEQRLAHLETSLGHRLFDRATGGFALNAAGAAALAEAAQMEMAACSLQQKGARFR